MLYLLPI